jgi:sigma-E factor negative regulatory protein RseB
VRRARLLAGGIAGLSLLTVGVAARAGEPGMDSEWSRVVDDAREQLESQTFDGVVAMEWTDAEGPRREHVRVRQHGGRVEVVDGEGTLASDASTVMLDGQAWTTLGAAGDTGGLAEGKYDIDSGPGPVIAGIETTRYEASRDGRVVERVYAEDPEGLVLRREVFGPDGKVARSMSFMRVVERAASDTTSSTIAPRPGPEPVEDLDAPYRDPAHAGDGYRLLGRWQHSDDLAQLYYSDGVLSVSVFEQPGRLVWDNLPSGGESVELDGRRAKRYALPVGDAWVFERGGVVYTCVGDATTAEVAQLANDVSRPDESRVERLARMVVEPFRW